MVTVRCNEPKKPMCVSFNDLPIGVMFLDTDDKHTELLIKTNDRQAIGLADGETYNFISNGKVQLCDVDISYTPKYEK